MAKKVTPSRLQSLGRSHIFSDFECDQQQQQAQEAVQTSHALWKKDKNMSDRKEGNEVAPSGSECLPISSAKNEERKRRGNQKFGDGNTVGEVTSEYVVFQDAPAILGDGVSPDTLAAISQVKYHHP